MKATPRIEFLIDELILHGFSAADRDAIGDSLSRELGRLAAAGNLSALDGLADIPALRTTNISLSAGARPETVGVQTAQAVFGSLRGNAGEQKR